MPIRLQDTGRRFFTCEKTQLFLPYPQKRKNRIEKEAKLYTPTKNKMNVFDKPGAEPNKVQAMPRREKVHDNERFR